MTLFSLVSLLKKFKFHVCRKIIFFVVVWHCILKMSIKSLLTFYFLLHIIFACDIKSVDVSLSAAPSSPQPLPTRFNVSDVVEHFRQETMIMRSTLDTTLSCIDSRNEGIQHHY